MVRALLREHQIGDRDNLSEHEHEVLVHENLVTSGTLNFQDGTISGTGDVYATTYYGDGSNLTGISGGSGPYNSLVDDGETGVLYTKSGAAELYYATTKTFETTTDGIEIGDGTSVGHFYYDGTSLRLDNTSGPSFFLYTEGGERFRSTTGGIQVRSTLGKQFETGDDALTLWNLYGTGDRARLVFTANDFYIENWNEGKNFILTARQAGASTQTNLFVGDPDGSVELYYAGTKVFETYSTGVQIGNGSETTFVFHSGDDFVIRNAQDSGVVRIQGRNSSSSLFDMITADPNYGILLKHNTAEMLETRTDGVNIHNSAITIRNTGGITYWRSHPHGDNVRIEAENGVGSTVSILRGDPDGASELYHNGTKTAETTSEGIEVIGGVKFPATASLSSNANTLDDYEEGTWTPVFADASSGGNTSSTSATTGIYRKIGSTVWFFCQFSNINTSGMTGANQSYVRGLPFTEATPGSGIPLATVWGQQITFTNYMMAEITSTYLSVKDIRSAQVDSFVNVSDYLSGSADLRIMGWYVTSV